MYTLSISICICIVIIHFDIKINVEVRNEESSNHVSQLRKDGIVLK